MHPYTPTRQQHCLWCLKHLDTMDFSFLIRHDFLCDEHATIANNNIKVIRIEDENVHYIQRYTSEIASIMFRYKEHYDLPLSGCLFYPNMKKLKKIIKDRVCVIVPSSDQKTEQRGFIPLKTALDICGIQTVNMLIKQSDYDQKGADKQQRKQTHFSINPNVSITTTSLVLFDDVLTTGHSLLTCASLLRSQGYDVMLIVYTVHSSWFL